jgi:DNA excision repair protein ERCC-2
LHLSVTEVALSQLPRAIGFAGRLRELFTLGVEAHLAYQRSAAESVAGFEAEVAVRGRRDRGGWRVTLGGRCDGVRPVRDGLVVEELKHVAHGAPSRALREAASLQAELYAWMLEPARAATCSAEIVWLAGDAVTSREPGLLSREAMLARLDTFIDAAIAAAMASEEELARRRAAAPSVAFPFEQLRPGQAEIARAAEDSLAAREHLLLEAPTGLGKTAAVLTAALRFALASDLRLFVLTSRTLQQRLALETLRRIAPRGVRVAAHLRNKSAMCATGELKCHEDVCSYARTHRAATQEHSLALRALASGIAEPDEVFALGEKHGACPFELMADVARAACVTVADANYAFDPGVALPELRDPETLARAILVIDEAHGLPARARDARTARLSGSALREAIAQIALGSSPAHARMRGAVERLAAALEAQVQEAVGDARDACVLGGFGASEAEELRALLGASFDAALGDLAGAPAFGPHAAFLDLAAAALAFLDAPTTATHRALAGRANGDAFLERACIDAAPDLARILGGAHSVIAMSATLSPPAWHASLLGLDAKRLAVARISGESRAERLCVVIDAALQTTLEARARELPKLVKRLSALARATPGNVLVVGPSFAWLAQLARALEDAGRRVACEQPGALAHERERWLGALRGERGVLALAIAGGALTEGFDTSGLGLRAVAVLGPCLPARDARRELEREYYEESLGDGFALAYALPGMTRVIQSAGRLLRQDGDRGVIALYGARFLRDPYVGLLPEAWLNGREPSELAGDPARAARAFFASEP